MQINTSSLFVNLNGRPPVLQNGFLKLIDKKMHSFYGGNEEIRRLIHFYINIEGLIR